LRGKKCARIIATLFHPKSRRNYLQAGLLARPTKGRRGLLARKAQWLDERRRSIFRGLTVAVTTRDLHPLPYSPAALLTLNGGEHLKVLTKNRLDVSQNEGAN